jgi:hypothetical protein
MSIIYLFLVLGFILGLGYVSSGKIKEFDEKIYDVSWCWRKDRY